MTFDSGWAFIADLYLPILAVSVVLSLYHLDHRHLRILRLKRMILALMIAYGFMLVDMILNIWPAFDLDYSTHTALSLVFVGYFVIFSTYWLKISFIISLIWYCELMARLHYHTYLDMITTVFVVFPLVTIALNKYNAL